MKHGKTHRITQACIACQKRKSRCSGGHPCTKCAKLNTPCSYAPVITKRGPRPRHEQSDHSSSPTPEPSQEKDSQNIGQDGVDVSVGPGMQRVMANYFFDYLTSFFPILQKQTLFQIIERDGVEEIPNEMKGMLAALNAVVSHFMISDGESSVTWTATDAIDFYTHAIDMTNRFCLQNVCVESLQALVLMLIAAFSRDDVKLGRFYLSCCTKMALHFQEEMKLPNDDILSETKRRLWWSIFALDRALTSLFRSTYLIHIPVESMYLPQSERYFQFTASFSPEPLCRFEDLQKHPFSSSFSYYIHATSYLGAIVTCVQVLTERTSPYDASNRFEHIIPAPSSFSFPTWLSLKSSLSSFASSLPSLSFSFLSSSPPSSSSSSSASSALSNFHKLITESQSERQSYMNVLATFHYARLMLYSPYAMTFLIPLPTIPWLELVSRNDIHESAHEMVQCAKMVSDDGYPTSMTSPICGGGLFITFMVFLSEYREVEEKGGKREVVDEVREKVKVCVEAVTKVSRVWKTVRGLVTMMHDVASRNGVRID